MNTKVICGIRFRLIFSKTLEIAIKVANLVIKIFFKTYSPQDKFRYCYIKKKIGHQLIVNGKLKWLRHLIVILLILYGSLSIANIA